MKTEHGAFYGLIQETFSLFLRIAKHLLADNINFLNNFEFPAILNFLSL